MSRPRNPVPKYLKHKPSGLARVRVAGRDIYLGTYGSAESKREYQRVCAELATAAPAAAPATAAARTVNEVVRAFWDHAEAHYRGPDGAPTSEMGWLRESLEALVKLYGHTPAAEFGPLALRAVRQTWIAADYCRTTVNARTNRVRRVFKWAVSEELVPVAVHAALATVAGLVKGRTAVRESPPVRPSLDLHVAAALVHLAPTVRAMVLVQRLSGARPQDVRQMRAGEIDRTGSPWVYRPPRHKTRYRGAVREVRLGRAAQEVIAPYLAGKTATDYVFTPAAARAERYAALRAARKSPVQPSQRSRAKPTKSKKRRVPPAFTTSGYDQAIGRACARAGVPHWHPNQLRHAFATEVRALFGLEAAQVLLGHAKANVTQVYAERDAALAARVADKIG
ncbi:MAG: phage integrase family protein [Planctomycetes bacterium]|nr:phage integrase family protein [Planctomycetota bacterium]